MLDRSELRRFVHEACGLGHNSGFPISVAEQSALCVATRLTTGVNRFPAETARRVDSNSNCNGFSLECFFPDFSVWEEDAQFISHGGIHEPSQ